MTDGSTSRGVLGSLTHLYTNKKTLEMRDKHHKEKTKANAERFKFDKEKQLLTLEQIKEDIIRRKRERAEDKELQEIRDDQAHTNAIQRINWAWNLSIKGWLNDQYYENSGIKTLRMFFQSDMERDSHKHIESDLNAMLSNYNSKSVSGNYPIRFSTGAWKINKDSGMQTGSWSAHELHSINRNVPTIIFRLEKVRKNGYELHADMLGFQLENTIGTLHDSIKIGIIDEEKPETISQVVSLLAATLADVYFFSNYARPPVMPRLITEYEGAMELPEIGAMMERTIVLYRNSLNALVEQMPQAHIPAMLSIADALAALPDKTHAKEQCQLVMDSYMALRDLQASEELSSTHSYSAQMIDDEGFLTDFLNVCKKIEDRAQTECIESFFKVIETLKVNPAFPDIGRTYEDTKQLAKAIL